MAKKRFPTFWVIILIAGIIWFLSELGYVNFNVPWLPLIVVIIALGAILNRLNN